MIADTKEICHFLNRADELLNLKNYSEISSPICVKENIDFVVPYQRQYILRMLINAPGMASNAIPPELKWLEPAINLCTRNQDWLYLYNPYVYVTVRHGFVTSETDDEWHVDGFSMLIPCTSDQNYFWSNVHPTQHLEQSFEIPNDFNPFQHNINHYFNDNAKEENTRTLKEKAIYLMDTYCVHRRQPNIQNTMRTFWRISFLENEIRDDTCTPNPLLPVKKYNRTDIRQNLIRYPVDKANI